MLQILTSNIADEDLMLFCTLIRLFYISRDFRDVTESSKDIFSKKKSW